MIAAMTAPGAAMHPALHVQERSRRGFDEVAEAYGARPGYPPQLFEALFERCGLGPGSKVLEVGAGTGQVTVPLAQRGLEVTAVELGSSMAGRLRDASRGLPVNVIVEPFEEVEVEEAAFDAVISATAFHWVDPGVGFRKASRALRDEGHVALWWTLFDQPDRPDRFFHELKNMLSGTAPDVLAMLGGPAAYCRDIDARRAEFAATGQFGPVEMLEFEWDCTHTSRQLRHVFTTYSPVMALPHKRREALLDRLEELASNSADNVVTRSYATVMYLAERRSRHSVS